MKRIYRTREKPTEKWVPHEYMIEDSSEISSLPNGEAVPAGSMAYTADLTLMLQYDGTEWVEIGGS